MGRIVSLHEAKQQKTQQTIEEWKAEFEEGFKKHPNDLLRTTLCLDQLRDTFKVWVDNTELVLLRMLSPRLEVTDHHTSVVISIQDVKAGWVPIIELLYTTVHQNLVAGEKIIIDEAFAGMVKTKLMRHTYRNRIYAIIEKMADVAAAFGTQYTEFELLKWEDTDDEMTIEFRGTDAALGFNQHVVRFYRKRLYAHFEHCKQYRQEHHLDDKGAVLTFTPDM